MDSSQSPKGPLLATDGSESNDYMAELESSSAEDRPHSFTNCPHEKPSMAALPDVVLLDVLRLLDTSQLLVARSVCRRWNVLAFEPRVWSGRRVWSKQRGLQRFALRLAPCLSTLHAEDAVELLARTHCAVTKLLLTVRSAAPAEEAVRRQVELGRIREVDLHFKFDSKPPGWWTQKEWTALAGLFVAASSGLVEKVSLGYAYGCAGHGEQMKGAFQVVCKNRLKASVKELDCSSATQLLAPAVQFLLETHAPTLEVVSLGEDLPPLHELPALPRLRKLYVECQPMADMSSLLQSRALETVSLVLGGGEVDFPPECAEAYAEFFRGATWLKNVTLYLSDEPVLAQLDLVTALGASERSELRQLRLVGDWIRGESDDEYEEEDVEEPLVPRLMVALPGLPHLHVLTVEPEISPEQALVLLDHMSPCTTPSLVRLDLKMGVLSDWPCCHDWVHRCQVVGALRRNPLLHVRFNHWGSECEGQLYSKKRRSSKSCPACPFGCHHELQMQELEFHSLAPYSPFNKDKDLGITNILLFSHKLGEQCDQHGDSAHPISLADDEAAFHEWITPCGKSQCSHCHSDN